jgi:hypothetical protein
MHAYECSDPGDFWRKVRVNFIPRVTEPDQRKGMFQVMSVGEAEAMVRAARAEGIRAAAERLMIWRDIAIEDGRDEDGLRFSHAVEMLNNMAAALSAGEGSGRDDGDF